MSYGGNKTLSVSARDRKNYVCELAAPSAISWELQVNDAYDVSLEIYFYATGK